MGGRMMGVVLGLAMATPASAMDFLDQKQDVSGTSLALIGSGGTRPVGQTVTCGFDGHLSSVSLPLYSLTGLGSLTVEILEHSGFPSAPDGKVRAKMALSATDIPMWPSTSWTNIAVSPPIALSKSMEYSIVVRATRDVVWPLGPNWLDLYPDGDAWRTNVTFDWEPWAESGAAKDFMFMTFMDVSNTSLADVELAIENLAMSIIAIPPSRIVGGAAAHAQLVETCYEALGLFGAFQLDDARDRLQFILDRSDEDVAIPDWFLSSDAGPIWLEAMDAWAMIGFAD